jgi:hypothetical protein
MDHSFFRIKKKLEDDPFQRNLFALADRKRCFVKDLSNLTIEELNGWIAFYEIQAEEMKQ